ncbi:MAG: hypothetical protein ACOVVK_11645 [Elsteraceae bacterium]
MKILTVWQPWASLIILGAKPYEFRGWKPPRSIVGQRIGIHAGAKRMPKEELWQLFNSLAPPDAAARTCLRVREAAAIIGAFYNDRDSLPFSQIIGTAVVGEPRLGADIAKEFGAAALGFPEGKGFAQVDGDIDSDQSSNWGWPMLDIKPLIPPIDAKGKQGLWDFPVPAQEAA